MRFVFLSYNYSPDIHTPEEWTSRINFYAGSLQALGKKHTVIRVDQINYLGNFVHNGIQYYCVDNGKRKNYFPRRLNKFVKSLQPDIVIVSSFLFPIQVMQLRNCLGNKVKIFIQHHAERPFEGLKKIIQRWASRCADAYIFTSSEIGLDWVNKGNLVHANKINEILEGTSVFAVMDKDKAIAKTGTSGSPIFIWAGRLNANKDPLTVVSAFLKFAAIDPAAKLYMIYQTTELLNEIKKLIGGEKKCEDSIVLIGRVAHSEMYYWFSSADFIISGSHYEGSGIAVCEAMSCGCIPIVTSIPSFRKITNGGHCGLLYPAGDEESLFSALRETMKMNREEKRKTTLDYFNRELSFEAIALKFQQLAVSL